MREKKIKEVSAELSQRGSFGVLDVEALIKDKGVTEQTDCYRMAIAVTRGLKSFAWNGQSKMFERLQL